MAEHTIGYIVQYKNDGRYRDRTQWRRTKTDDISKARIYYSEQGAYGSCTYEFNRENRRWWYNKDSVDLIPLVIEVE